MIGQDNFKKRLMDVLFQGHPLQHAFLFCADKGMGKKSFSLYLAKNILCLNNKDKKSIDPKMQEACGHCDSCRFFAANTHPDFKVIDRGQESIIKVNRIRKEIISDIHMRPQFSDYKVYLIDADALNQQGQNALLKSLEEPPDHVVFILTTTLLDNLLDTILSRVAILNLQPYSNSEIKKILEQNGIESNLDFVISYAGGNPGAALQIAKDENFQEVRQKAIDLFFKFPTVGRTTLLTDGLDFFKNTKHRVDLVLNLWQNLIRDALVLLDNDTIKELSQTDLEERLKKLVDYYSAEEKISNEKRKEQLLDAYESITEVRKASIVNASYEGMIGQLLLRIRKDLHIDG